MPDPDRTPRQGGRLGAAALLLAAGGLLIAAAVVALVLGILGGGDDEDGRTASGAAGPGTVVIDDNRFGVRLRYPASWQRDDDRRAIRLTSPGRRVGVSLTTVASRPAVSRVRASLERQTVQAFDPAEVLERSRGRVGGRPARLTAIRGHNARDEALDVLLATVASRWRTYAVVTFGNPRAPAQAVREAESILASLQFIRPGS